MLLLRVSSLLLWTLYGALSQELVQLECVKRAKLGDTVVLKCLTHSLWSYIVWYKQATDKTLQLLSSADYKYTSMVSDHRYLTESSATETNLTIFQMTEEDVGTYYCGLFKSREVVFGSGTVLEIEGESEPVQSVLQSPEYIRAKPGDSVTLSCSFTSSQRQQEHTRVMWVKAGLDSQIISWNYGKENIFCENKEEALCIYNLTLKDLTSAEDGTYLCVVSACGDTLIGNATRIHLYDTESCCPAVIALIGSSAVVGLVVLVLLWGMWRLSNNKTGVNSEHQRAPHSSQPDDTFTYAAGSLDSSTVRRRKHPDIYSQVCYRHCR